MIELRSRPQEPKGRKVLERLEIELFERYEVVHNEEGEAEVTVPAPSLAEVVSFFQTKGVDISQVRATDDDISFRDPGMYRLNPKFEYVVLEPEEEYAARLETYRVELEEYKRWYNENREEIKATKASIREEKQRQKEEQKAVRKMERLQRQREKIERELANME